MIFNGNNLIKLQSNPIFTDVVAIETPQKKYTQIILLKDDAGYTLISKDLHPNEDPFSIFNGVGVHAVNISKSEYIEDFLKESKFTKSQKLLAAVIDDDECNNYSNGDLNNNEPLGLLYSSVKSDSHFIVNGVDILVCSARDVDGKEIGDISGGSCGAYINKSHLIYSSHIGDYHSIPVTELSVEKINNISENFINGLSFSIKKIESYLGYELPKKTPVLVNNIKTHYITLPEKCQLSHSKHGFSFIKNKEIYEVSIFATYLGSVRQNDKKYSLYGNNGTLLFISHSDKFEGFHTSEFEHIEFESLNFIFSSDYLKLPEHMEDGLISVLKTMGIETETQFASHIPLDYLRGDELKLTYGSVKTQDGIENVFVVAGDEVFNEELNGVHVAIFASKQHLNCLVGVDKAYSFDSSDVYAIISFIHDQMGKKAKNKQAHSFFQKLLSIFISHGTIVEKTI